LDVDSIWASLDSEGALGVEMARHHIQATEVYLRDAVETDRGKNLVANYMI
jgi:hypothetical protein